MERVTHEFQPVFNRDSRVLILGTFPSVKSRQQQFYYGHPQNRFWKLMERLLIDTCDIEGSSDSSIRNVKANDIGGLLAQTSIRAVFANGDKACQLYRKYCMEQAGREIIRLPSTSPANAARTLEKLIQAWSLIREYM